MAKVGRPKFVIDYERVAELAKMNCTQAEIAAVLGCCTETLQRDAQFCAMYSKKVAEGKMYLRQLQWANAAKGNVTMQIWLGKQLLGQRDIPLETGDDTLGTVTAAIAQAVRE